jgi:hypothetical protein
MMPISPLMQRTGHRKLSTTESGEFALGPYAHIGVVGSISGVISYDLSIDSYALSQMWNGAFRSGFAGRVWSGEVRLHVGQSRFRPSRWPRP